MPDFNEAHERFIAHHAERRSGERRGRLARGHRYAEKLLLQQVWWPLFGNFDHLHPEYEVEDWNRKSQFLDFAFLPPDGRFGIECDGYQSHIKDMDREGFSYALNRDTYLTGMGWKMIHFSFDDVLNRPDLCRMLLQFVLGAHFIPTHAPSVSLSPIEKEVLRFAWQLGRPVRPRDILLRFSLNFRTARKPLQSLAAKDLMAPVSHGSYIVGYTVNERALAFLV